ncbi:MAG: Asp-tRNA(Asn)/Glu-tRNA(Gln) amidotransferase subunit GatA [Desulfobulbaceae bacterium]|nr:Asp-tRNA(Asn)/Glu-tRNA(Gln) amidotransferase subunit GatA [Desulfobulbaceae bacterium]
MELALYDQTIHQLQELLQSKQLSSVELTNQVLNRIDQVEPQIGAFITECRDLALSQAAAADQMLAKGEGGPLCGIPLSIKDVLCTKGVRTTCGSKILEPFVPPYDATVITRLKEQGAVMVGKVSMDEFAMGSANENCAYGTPKNPWNTNHICGGSSGGSAASVASGECIASLGSDTGGSVRQPASHCGVVGMKPTYGRVSRFGLLAFASSLDQIGPLTKDVRDCAMMLNAIGGYDPKDSTSVKESMPDFTATLSSGLSGMRIGIPKEYFSEGLDQEVRAAVENGISLLRQAGAEIIEVSLPHTEYGIAAYYIIAPAEASSNLARYDGVKYGFRNQDASTLLEMYKTSRSQGFGPEVKRRIILGTYALSSGYYDAYYKKASQVRTKIVEDYQRAFTACDALVSPVTPTPAWRLGDKADDPLAAYLSDAMTICTNLAGLPAMSLPCGFSTAGLPIGFQIQGPHFQEGTLLKIAFALEQALGISQRRPPIST